MAAGTVTLRTRIQSGATTKGSRLTHEELDDNFIHKRTESNTVAFTDITYHQNRAINVKTDFGAVGDGVTNDASSIQTALDHAAVAGTKATVRLPRGVYNLGSTTLSLPANVILVGESTESTFINYTGSGTAIDIAGVSEWGLRDFRLGLGTSATITGIKVRTTAGNSILRGRVDRLEIAGSSGIVAGQIGIHAVASGADIFSECWFNDITLIEVDKPIIRDAIEGNFWRSINITEFGDTNGAIAIDSSCHADFLQARIAGQTGSGTNKVAYKQTGAGNNDNIVVDIGSGHTALNVTGTDNIIVLGRTQGTTPLGTIAADNCLIDGQTGPIVQILGKSAVAVIAPADAVENALATITVPARALASDGILRVRCFFTYTNSANAKTLRIRYSGAAGTTHVSVSRTTQLTSYFEIDITNRGATNSQLAAGLYGSHGDGTVTTYGSASTSAVDTTAATTVVITAEKANAGETVTLESYCVELLRP